MKIGFACIYLDPVTKKTPLELRSRTATLSFVGKMSVAQRHEYLWPIIRQNLSGFQGILGILADGPANKRMFRITSDLLPLFTHSVSADFYSNAEVRDYIETSLSRIGEFARAHDIRLSQHPGQYVVLNSTNPVTVQNSIAELEYHTDIARKLGYTVGWHDHGYTMNIHGGSRAGGTDNFIQASKSLSEEARRILTVENDENSYDIADLLPIAQHYPLVVDPFHHLIHSGNYIAPSDPLVQQIVDSWRGVRPKMHGSTFPATRLVAPGYDELTPKSLGQLPTRDQMFQLGLNRTSIRAHSQSIWPTEVIDYFSSFLDVFDLMLETKLKNLSADSFVNYLKKTGLHSRE